MACVLLMADGQADPCRFPQRKIGNKIADISNLFAYWKSGAGTNTVRPAKSWKLVSGSIVATRPYAMVVDAEVWDSPGQGPKRVRIYLWRAPFTEVAAAEAARQEMAGLNHEREGLAAVSYYNREAAQAHERTAGTARVFGRGDVAAAQDGAAQRSWSDVQGTIDKDRAAAARAAEVRQNVAGYAPPGRVEVFALDTGRKCEGLPLYDTGLVNP